MLTRRHRLRELLASRDEGFSLDELVEIMSVKRQVVLADLKHLQLSLRHREERLLMVPPTCGTCGFMFRAEEPIAPSKCPQCKSRKVDWPVFKVESEARPAAEA